MPNSWLNHKERVEMKKLTMIKKPNKFAGVLFILAGILNIVAALGEEGNPVFFGTGAVFLILGGLHFTAAKKVSENSE